jgi:hypothetical protein
MLIARSPFACARAGPRPPQVRRMPRARRRLREADRYLRGPPATEGRRRPQTAGTTTDPRRSPAHSHRVRSRRAAGAIDPLRPSIQGGLDGSPRGARRRRWPGETRSNRPRSRHPHRRRTLLPLVGWWREDVTGRASEAGGTPRRAWFAGEDDGLPDHLPWPTTTRGSRRPTLPRNRLQTPTRPSRRIRSRSRSPRSRGAVRSSRRRWRPRWRACKPPGPLLRTGRSSRTGSMQAR